MNSCKCENQNCKHNVYIQPPRAVLQQKKATYIRTNIPMQYESEQKLSYKKHSTQNNLSSLIKSSTKTNCFGNSLKFDSQYPFESTQHSSYKNWKTPNKFPIKKPKDSDDLLGSGPINLNTTNRIEYQRKISNRQSKKFNLVKDYL